MEIEECGDSGKGWGNRVNLQIKGDDMEIKGRDMEIGGGG